MNALKGSHHLFFQWLIIYVCILDTNPQGHANKQIGITCIFCRITQYRVLILIYQCKAPCTVN